MIKKIIPILLAFEQEDGETKEFNLKIANFDKKKQKTLKKFGKKLEKEHQELNDKSMKVYTEEQKLLALREDLEDAQSLADAEKSVENVKAVISCRKELRKQEKAVMKLRKSEQEAGSEETDEVNTKIFRKQLELIVVDPDELLKYVDDEGYSYAVVVSEIFRLLKKAQAPS